MVIEYFSNFSRPKINRKFYFRSRHLLGKKKKSNIPAYLLTGKKEMRWRQKKKFWWPWVWGTTLMLLLKKNEWIGRVREGKKNMQTYSCTSLRKKKRTKFFFFCIKIDESWKGIKSEEFHSGFKVGNILINVTFMS